jgi:glycosyltransferase involved in cell wall biosynthesis
MKLCLVTPFPPRYLGFGHYAAALLPELAACGDIDELTVLVNDDVPSPGPRTQADRFRILPCWKADSPALVAQTLSAVAGAKPDVVWFNSGLMLQNRLLANVARIATPALTRRLGFPTVVTLHNLLQGDSVRQLGFRASPGELAAGDMATRMLLKVDRACVTLQRWQGLLQSRYNATNVHHIPHHVFHDPVNRFVPRRKGLRLVSFGVMAPHKGMDVLLAAQAELAIRFGTELRVAGGPHPRFPGFCPGLDTPGTRFLGQVSEQGARRLIAWGDIVVLPSRATAGSSSVAHRAAAAGKTIVASDLPDLRSLAAEEGIDVHFFPPGDIAALTDVIARLITEVDLRARAAERNLAAAAALTPRRIARRYVRLFEAVSLPAAKRVPQAVSPLPATAQP